MPLVPATVSLPFFAAITGVTDAMIQSLFSALGTSRGTVEIDTFLQWLFQDQLAESWNLGAGTMSTYPNSTKIGLKQQPLIVGFHDFGGRGA